MVIEVGKTYLNRAGQVIRITGKDGNDRFPINGRTETNEFKSYTAIGQYFTSIDSDDDLVSEIKFADITSIK